MNGELLVSQLKSDQFGYSMIRDSFGLDTQFKYPSLVAVATYTRHLQGGEMVICPHACHCAGGLLKTAKSIESAELKQIAIYQPFFLFLVKSNESHFSSAVMCM